VLHLVIAEAALELVPDQIAGHASVRNEARRRDVEPRAMLLDRSIHHAAMLKLEGHLKRGRPDLVHLTLLNVTSSPLYQDGLAKVYIHTHDDQVLEFKEQTRPPKSYSRFRDLVQKVLDEGPDSGLIMVYDSSIRQLLNRIGSDAAIGLSIQGEKMSFEGLGTEILRAKNPVVLIGGFPHGHFTPETSKALDRLVRVDERSLDAHVVAARLIYEVEKRAQS
jgi:rRNA small subunit pseudouridine methyltransferase Nep1